MEHTPCAFQEQRVQPRDPCRAPHRADFNESVREGLQSHLEKIKTTYVVHIRRDCEDYKSETPSILTFYKPPTNGILLEDWLEAQIGAIDKEIDDV